MPSGLSLPLAFGMYTRLMGSWSVSLLPERKRQFAKPSLHPVRLDGLEVLTIHPRRALVGAAVSIGMRQNVLAADLVVEGVEAVAGFCLRFRVQRRQARATAAARASFSSQGPESLSKCDFEAGLKASALRFDAAARRIDGPGAGYTGRRRRFRHEGCAEQDERGAKRDRME